MPRRSETRGADEILSRVAAGFARSTSTDEALSDFNSALTDSLPGVKAWIFHLSEDRERFGGSWISGEQPPPFLPSVALDPRSAMIAVTLNPSVMEFPQDNAGPAFAEAPYLKRRGGCWWYIPVTDRAPAGILVLNHKERAAVGENLEEIRRCCGLLYPYLALLSSRSELESRIGARTSELELFYETSRALAFTKSTDEVAAVLADNLGEHLDLDVLGLLTLRPERSELYIEAAGSPSSSALRAVRRSMLTEAASAGGRRPGRLAVRVNRRSSAHSLVAAAAPDDLIHVHLSVQGRFLGLVSVHAERLPLDESRLRLLYTVASQAALTLDRMATVEEVSFIRIQSVLSSMSEGVILLDRRCRVVMSNPAAETLAIEIHGKPLPKKLRRIGRIPISSVMEILASGSMPPPYEVAQADPERYYQITASPVNGLKGTLDGLVLVISDVTQQRRLQDQLAQSEKLSSLGVMISGFAHELNNPLASIMGYAQLLAERDLVHDVQKKVAAINNEASRCHRIVDNLLRFARKQGSERRPVDLNSVVGSVLQLMGYQLQSDGIIVDVDLDRNMRSLVGDFHALQQVLVNIINNAQHAMTESGGGGLLTIVTRCDGRVCAVEVTDNGPGISPENLKKIFDPFFSTKRVGKGTGLGLSIAYGTVKDHGGTILARSRPGGGSTFVMEFPASEGVAEVREPLAAAETAVERSIPGKRILVVEDEISLADMMCEALAAEGHHVDAAANGFTAKEMLLSARYDLIISDIKMPNMGGRELYDAVFQMDPALARRIIFSTGDSVSAETHAFFQKVGNPYLTKPFNLNDLFRLIQRTLQSS
jgi:two-component system NtrC family sensor kinase